MSYEVLGGSSGGQSQANLRVVGRTTEVLGIRYYSKTLSSAKLWHFTSSIRQFHSQGPQSLPDGSFLRQRRELAWEEVVKSESINPIVLVASGQGTSSWPPAVQERARVAPQLLGARVVEVPPEPAEQVRLPRSQHPLRQLSPHKVNHQYLIGGSSRSIFDNFLGRFSGQSCRP